MSAIHAFRATNVKYNKQQFIMDNLYLTFANDTDLVHALATMPNGFGKGVILQLIFQIFKPVKDWQKGKGRVTQFFHSTHGFSPYTFYSALEWKLDGAEEKYLITGIAMTAKRVKEDDSGPKTEINYKLFTIKCDASSEYRLEKLPYWDEETGESWPLSRWEDHAKESEQQIRLYNKDELRKFRAYLQENGIFADEWDEMYEMNQNEAGTTIHFEKLGADHNDGLFKNVIIPSIESNLRRQMSKDGRDLKELFIEVAKIAHNLNTLLARKSSMTGLLVMLEEVDGMYQKVEESEKDLHIHAQRGSYLKSGLIERIEEADRDLATLGKERQDADDAVNDAQFRIKNLSYIEKQYQISDLNKQIRKMNEIFQTEKSNASEKKLHMEEAELAIIRKEYEDISRQLDTTISQINSLMMRDQLKDVKSQQEELKNNIYKEWPILLQNLRQTVNDAIGYQSVLKTNIQMADNELTEANVESRNISREIGIIQEKIRSFQSKLNEMETKYNVNQTFTLTQLIHLAAEDHQRCIERIDREKEVQGQLNQRYVEIQRETAKLETQIQQDEVVIESINDNYAKQLKLEVDAAVKLQLFSGSALPAHQERYAYWLKEQLPELVAEASRKEQVLRREEEEIRRLESEHMITEGGIWVPNPTILQLRDIIKSHGYTCLLGTEYIHEKSESERDRLKQTAKLLPYGLIILEKEREHVLRLAAAFKNRILFQPVPLFTVEIIDIMDAPSFIMLSNRADEIGFSPEALETFLVEAEQELVSRNQKLRHAIAEMDTFKGALKLAEKALDAEKCAEQLGEECQVLEDACELKKKQLKNYTYEDDTLQSKLSEVRTNLQKLQGELNGFENKKLALEELYQSWNEHKSNENKLIELKAFEDLINDKIKKISDNKRDAENELDEQRRAYSDWKNSTQRELDRYRESIPSLPAFDFQSQVPSIFPPATWPSIPKSLETHFINWEICQKTLEQANAQLAKLEAEKGIYAKLQEDKRRELFALNEEWAQKVAPTESLDVLKQRRIQISEEYETADQKRQQLEVEISNLDGSVRTMITSTENLKIEIENVFKPREVDFKSGIDVEYERKEFNFKLSQASEKLQSTKSLISETLNNKSIWERSSEALQHLKESNHRVPRDVYLEVGSNARNVVRDWVMKAADLDKALAGVQNVCFQAVKGVQKKIKDAKWDNEMKQHGDDFFDSLLVMDQAIHVRQKISEAKMIYEGILEREEANLNQAQEAELRWVQTATEHSRQIISHISEMVKGMSIRNNYGISFPLMKLKDDSMPRIEDIEASMKELFRQTLRFIEDKKVEFSRLQKNELGNRLDPGEIVYAAYNYAFPTMQVYNMNVENSFWVDKPYEKYFKDWEVFLQGSDEEATGSGGQRLAAFTLLSIMITTQKRRRDKHAKRSVLINDNPFANAVSEHVLDPIFRVADALGIQWIVVAPPELVNKMEVSERFPSYYGLDLESDGTGKRRVVVSSRHIRNRVEFQQLEFTT
ncbi:MULTISPECIES: hypothetical protein [unclassified Paenibacillus]|uniref:hypothetical protein n=1 Tax=unclassified Paenibacillus TaxID=185978 RepID=UPI00277EE12C|nr:MULTISPECIES: hypothetical protein [unclassified Paenibacillus]MDQ0896309.1 hypothetical protein [Paenibacillus sp. V4I7]MDQ0913763.1 hypothetical protein [Paenibacillus sp. V4I5]